MNTPSSWKEEAQQFFRNRSRIVSKIPTLEEICYASGRDWRIWQNSAIRNDLTDFLTERLSLSNRSKTLEVGSGSGFIAYLLSSRVGSFVGADTAKEAVAVATRLNLPNATFVTNKIGEGLPFLDASFDSTIAYNVIINYPTLGDFKPILKEMLRVTKGGGRVLIGAVPDENKTVEAAAAFAAIGPIQGKNFDETFRARWLRMVSRLIYRREPRVTTYVFKRQDFFSMGKELGCEVEIFETHKLNPLYGMRFDVVFRRI